MLVLSRKNHESVIVGDGSCLERVLKVTVLDVKRDKVRLGFEAHGDFPIYRSEIWQRICGESPPANRSTERKSVEAVPCGSVAVVDE